MSDEIDDAIASLEAYLRRYPSGHFSEIAQARLELLLAQRGEKKVVIPSQDGNPFTRGTVYADTRYTIGDEYRYASSDEQSDSARRRRISVTAVSQVEVPFNNGRFVTDLLGNVRRRPDGSRLVDSQNFPAEFFIGKRWVSRPSFTRMDGKEDTAEINFVIAARETIEIPAGRFSAFRVEGTGWTGMSGHRNFKYWIAPDQVRKHLVQEFHWTDGRGRPLRNTREELAGYVQAIAPGNPA